MEYMLVFVEPTTELARRTDPAEAPAYWAAWGAYIGQLQGSGLVKSGNGLQAPETGTTVQVRNGQRIVQDGPFPDSKEHLGGYFIIDAPSLDVALQWAERAPCAACGSVEVRPVMVMA